MFYCGIKIDDMKLIHEICNIFTDEELELDYNRIELDLVYTQFHLVQFSKHQLKVKMLKSVNTV